MSHTFLFILLILINSSFSLPSCKEGDNFCTKCNPVTKLCEKCEKNVLIPDDNGGCKAAKKCQAGLNYCLECNSDDKLCNKCNYNYYPDENGGCSFINNCEISYQGNCLKCIEDFILVGKELKICKSLNTEDYLNCENIDLETGFCNKCKEGFYLNSGDKKCIKTNNCHESSNGVCTKCSLSYYLDKSIEECKIKNDTLINCQETIDGINCDKCDDNSYLDDNNKCIGVNYCSIEAPFVKCKKCREGYYLAEYGNCCSKEPNCNFGDKDLGICTQCKDFFYIDFKDGRCRPNNEDNDFKYCYKADGECYECVHGTYLGEDKKCSFSTNCAESHLGKCVHCINSEYHLGRDNICTNIDKCIYSNYYNSCEECEEGYFFNESSRVCEKEYQGFENCKKTDAFGDHCETCRNDFYVNNSDYLCYSNTEQNEFYKCAFTLGEVCDGCIEDYYLGSIDNKCSLIEGCDRSENENKCLECDSDIYCLDLKNNNCVNNEYIYKEEDKFYYKCNVTNEEGTKCALCIDDFRLNDQGLCVYDGFCEELDENGNCKKCIADNEKEYFFFCLNSQFGCTITSRRYCEICNDVTNFDKCDKCRDGYTLENNDCVENK